MNSHCMHIIKMVTKNIYTNSSLSDSLKYMLWLLSVKDFVSVGYPIDLE